MHISKNFKNIFGFVFLMLGMGLSFAQDFPTKPIRIFVGQGPGGGNDTLARIVAQRLTTSLGQPVLVENKVGAGGMIATEGVARSNPDGYSLLMGPIGNMVFTPVLSTKLRFSTTKDFVPVSQIANFPLILAVNTKLNLNSVQDLIAYMKANPAKSNYGGSGPAFQFASELFRIKTSTPGEFIQYKSTSETITALVTGDLVMSMVDTGPAMGAIAGGQIKALAVTSSNRLSGLPQVPTMAEAGLPDLEFRFWTGIFAPAGTPPAIVKKLETEINRILKMPEVVAQMANTQVIAQGSTSEELYKLLATDLIKWTQVADTAKMKKLDQ
ncbi:MAG: tripartite tricarboxylate transporter substrate binding protein [Betaproteobacteria bacterium]|jgi:tripartite-type tricarboxylate transporter receptor subunit TctC|nr:tripartite tricarboxylate transporter substrate binding protein [Betaproteobacteria bacterium]